MGGQQAGAACNACTSHSVRWSALPAPTRGVAGGDVEPVAGLQRHGHVHWVATRCFVAQSAGVFLQAPLAGCQVGGAASLSGGEHAGAGAWSAAGPLLPADQALQG